MTEAATLLTAAFFFLVAGFFWAASLVSRVALTRTLGFWYAVVFNNAGYFTLLIQCVTFS